MTEFAGIDGNEFLGDLLDGKTYNTFDEIKDEYSVAKMLTLISFAPTTGKIKHYITDEYKNEINPFESIDISNKYSKINEKNNVFKKLLGKEFTSVESLKEQFEKAVKSAYGVQKALGNTTSGNDGSSSGSMSFGGGAVSSKPSNNNEVKPCVIMYTDIDNVQWAADAIYGLTNKGVLSGDGNGLFRPNDGLVREELIKILVEAFDILDEKTTSDFADIPMSHWSYKYVSSAFSYGLVQGVGNGLFGQGALITREDVATLIFRLAEQKGMIDLTKLSSGNVYEDYYEISDYAKQAVRYLSANGLTVNIQNNKFSPKTPMSRAEAAATVWGFLKTLKGE